MAICFINAMLTAGCGTPIDILMNSVGLLILNDLDNIVGTLFIFVTGLKGHGEERKILKHIDCIFASFY